MTTRKSEIAKINAKYDKIDNLRASLKVSQEIYEVVPRWGDIDYHPQVIEAIGKTTVDVYEKGIKKRTTVQISWLRKDKNGWITYSLPSNYGWILSS